MLIKVEIMLPELLPGLKYSGEYRIAKRGELFLYRGKPKIAQGLSGRPYHIIVRAE